MKKSKYVTKAVAVILSLAMIIGTAACSKKANNDLQTASKTETKTDSSTVTPANSQSETEKSNDPDTSKFVTLKFYNMGDTPADMQKVQDEANKKYFEPLLNCDVEFDFLSWSDYETKYDLMLASGDNIDLIYTSNWCFYTQEATKGGFKELTMDFIKKYLPMSYESQDPASWEQAKIKGKIFCVPQNNRVYIQNYIAYRNDLKKKYNLSDLTDLNTLQNYLYTIASKETGIQAIASAGGNSYLFQEIARYLSSTKYGGNIQGVENSGTVDFSYFLKDGSAPSDSDIFYYYTSDLYKEAAELMAEWAKNGVWSKNAINNTVTEKDAYANGKSAILPWNAGVFTYGKKLDTTGLGTTEYTDICPSAKQKSGSFNTDAIAIAYSSKNPERAAMALDLMKNNVELNNLLQCGIKDVHYTVNADGNYVATDAAANYPWDCWAWGIFMSADSKAMKLGDTDPRLTTLRNNTASNVIKTDIDGFIFDATNVKTELDVVQSVIKEYKPSFELGMFGDETDAKLKEFTQKLTSSGLEKIKTEFLKQYHEYLDANK